jgi:hypothetical protein
MAEWGVKAYLRGPQSSDAVDDEQVIATLAKRSPGGGPCHTMATARQPRQRRAGLAFISIVLVATSRWPGSWRLADAAERMEAALAKMRAEAVEHRPAAVLAFGMRGPPGRREGARSDHVAHNRWRHVAPTAASAALRVS